MTATNGTVVVAGRMAAGAVVVCEEEQAATGKRSTCHCSCACGTTPHVVSPVHSELAGHSHATAPPRAYRHSKPAAHPPARRPEPAPASGKLPSATESPGLVVKTVAADTVTAEVAAGGGSVRRPRAKPGGYTTPAAKRAFGSRHDLTLVQGKQDLQPLTKTC